MANFAQFLKEQQSLSVEDQKRIGRSVAAKMDPKHEEFMKLILQLLEGKEIDILKPETFLKEEVYEQLSDMTKDKVDLALMNIADLLSQIVDFRLSKETPDESPELESMISYLWQMKERVEKQHGNVFKF